MGPKVINIGKKISKKTPDQREVKLLLCADDLKSYVENPLQST